jgi:diguanylate cyclase (GGDEF)-like protein
MEYTQALNDTLSKNSLFKGLTPNDYQELARILSQDTFSDGEVIVKEGDTADKIYVILKGKASVIKAMGKNGDRIEHQIAVLKAGDSIGDVALIDNQPRSATVKSLGDTETISFHIDQLSALSHHEDSIESKLKINFALHLSKYLRNTNNSTLAERQRHKSEITQLTNFDIVTGLPNQYLLKEKLKTQIAEHADEPMAIIQIEVIDYKEVCDALGNEIGDQLLTAISDRLTSSLSEVQVIARVGFNQFMILYAIRQSLPPVQALTSRIIRLFSSPFLVADDNIFTNIYIGIGHYPDDGIQPDLLIKRAGLALDAAKLGDPNTFAFYNKEMDALVEQRRQLIQELREAFAKDQFELFFQAQVDLKTNKLLGAETLIRWIHPEKGIISPVIFIPIVEQTGMIIKLGHWIFRKACEQAKIWNDWGHPLRLAVNLSAIQFKQKDLVEQFTKVINEIGIPPALIELEVTESMMMSDIDETINKLQRFVDMGFIMAMDDFGTGYSSLSNLRRLPIDKLKVDQSFVREISKDEDSKDIIRCIVGMAKGLRLHTIAEGIEDNEQRDFLNELGVDEGQGYLFSKPIPAAEFETKFSISSEQK